MTRCPPPLGLLRRRMRRVPGRFVNRRTRQMGRMPRRLMNRRSRLRVVARSRTVNRGVMTIPMVPADTTAPAGALSRGITAPIPTGTIPGIVVPAILLSAEEELRLLNQAKAICSCIQLACHGAGRSGLRSAYQCRCRAYRSGQRKSYSNFFHDGSSWLNL